MSGEGVKVIQAYNDLNAASKVVVCCCYFLLTQRKDLFA